MGISHQQALDCFLSDDLIGIGMEAAAVRRRLHPENVVTYLIDRTLCLTAPTLLDDIAEAVDLGATGITLRAAPTTPSSLAEIEALLTTIRARFPTLWLHGLSATAVATLAAEASLSISATLARLQASGLHSLAGDDTPLLDNSPGTQAWLDTHRAAHRLGLPTTAILRFGTGETPEDRVHHLEALRALQQQTGGLLSLRPTAAATARALDDPTAVEYLKTLAIARMLLDNLPHIEADWPAQGLKVLQMALRFGADDVGSTFPHESPLNPDGTTEEDLRRVIRGAGLRPAQRDTPHRTLFLT